MKTSLSKAVAGKPSSGRVFFTIGKRLFFSIFFITAMLTATSAYSVYMIFNTSAALKETIHKDLELARSAERWSLMVQINVARAFVRANVDLGNYKKTFEADASAMSALIGQAQKSTEALIDSTDEETHAEVEKVIKVRMKTVEITDYIAVLKEKGNKEAVDTYIRDTYTPQAKVYLEALANLAKYAFERADKRLAILDQKNLISIYVVVGIIIVAVIISFIFTYLLQHMVTKPLFGAVKTARAISEGNLTTVINRQEIAEFGDLSNALADMQIALTKTVSQIKNVTDEVKVVSIDISNGNNDLSSRTNTQMASVEKTVAAMNELTSTVKQNVENAQHTNELVASASDIATHGGEVMSNVVNTMKDINTSSGKIVEIINVINDIAFQTNILALNAAVEAARAGEQGRGFAVVASEVRNLAQRSASAATEIKALIESSVDKINLGSDLVGKAGKNMEDVVNSIKNVTTMVSEITTASQEQAKGIDDIDGAINEIDQSTQKNTELANSIGQSAQSLKEQSKKLNEMMGFFNISNNNIR